MWHYLKYLKSSYSFFMVSEVCVVFAAADNLALVLEDVP